LDDATNKGNGSLLDGSVRALLDSLASSSPAPGGGAAAALTGALGAALVQMTANLTIGKPRYASVQDQARVLESAADTARHRLEALADEDAAAFARVSAAYGLPRATEGERADRDAAIQESLRGAAQVPLETARTCREVLHLAEGAAPVLNRSVIADVMVGAQLANAGLAGAAINVEVNIASITDPAAALGLRAELDVVVAGATELLERIVAAGRARLVALN